MHQSWFHCFDRTGSLAYRTELMLVAHDALITERPDYLIIQTPDLPGYYWGNFLLFPTPPRPGDVARWEQVFAAEIGRDPAIKHCHLAWEHLAGDDRVVPDLVDSLQLIDDLVLVIDDLPSADRRNPALVVRPMSSDRDWAEVAALQTINDPLQREHEGYAAVRRHERARHRGGAHRAGRARRAASRDRGRRGGAHGARVPRSGVRALRAAAPGLSRVAGGCRRARYGARSSRWASPSAT
jgi:hypothetical protein